MDVKLVTTMIVYFIFAQLSQFSATQPSPTSPGPTNLQPLVFLNDDSEIFVIRMVWNPTMDISKIIELSQREVSYSWDQILDGPAPQFQPWRRLVKEDQGHDGSRRYAFVKDDQCKEVDFRLAWISSKGERFENVVQTLKPVPIIQPMNAEIELKGIVHDKSSGSLKAMVDWKMDTADWEKILREKPKPKVMLENCRLLFHETIPQPELMKGGHVIEFDPRYAQNGCEFKITLDFLTFDNDTDCYATYETKEFLMINLQCDNIEGLKCVEPKYTCDMNCSPDISVEPYFELDGNETLLFANATWTFSSISKTQPKSVQVRYFHSWLNYNYQPFENENETVQTLSSTEDNTMMLPALSVTPQAAWALQVCQIYDPKCPEPDWTQVPLNPIIYYYMHDELPPWVAASLKAIADAEAKDNSEKGAKGAMENEKVGENEQNEEQEDPKGAELPKKAAMKDMIEIGANSANGKIRIYLSSVVAVGFSIIELLRLL